MLTTVSIVIVSYNTRDLLVRCLHSVADSARDVSIEIIVVDNASADGSAEAARSATPHAQVLAQATNTGFAAACNVGVAAASGTHVLLLNPDTEMRSGCIEALLDCLNRHPDAGIIGGRTVHEDGTLDPHSCWAQPSLWSLVCFATGLSAVFPSTRAFDPESLGSWGRDTEREVGVVTGCLLLCPRTVWDRIGGMPEVYFVYGEDVEFSYRARELGYRPRITPDAEIVHVRGAASSDSSAKWEMMLRGKVSFMRRNWSGWRARFGVALLLFGAGLRAAAVRAHIPVAGPWRQNWSKRRLWIGGWEASMPAAAIAVRDSP